jgi:hypothetical protein
MPYRPPGLIALIYRQLEIEDDNREDERLCDLCTPAGNLEPYLCLERNGAIHTFTERRFSKSLIQTSVKHMSGWIHRFTA